MLVLSRKLNQAIMIGDNVRIVVVSVDRDQVKLGIDAPREIPVHRSEVFEEIQRTNRQAAGMPELPPASAPAVRPASTSLLQKKGTGKKR
jgi:carbon storage regulator